MLDTVSLRELGSAHISDFCENQQFNKNREQLLWLGKYYHLGSLSSALGFIYLLAFHPSGIWQSGRQHCSSRAFIK